MKKFNVIGGIIEFGPGQLVGLDKDQYELRAHRVDLVEKKGEGFILVKTRDHLQFKAGETIALEGLPKHMVDRLEPVDAPSTPLDQIAVQKAAATKKAAAKAKAAKDADQIEARSAKEKSRAVSDVKASRS